MSHFIFIVAAIAAVAGAIGVIALKNPYYSVLALVVNMIALAALFLLLHAQFLAFTQVVIYAGAVIVLYVFVVSYVGEDARSVAAGPGRLATLGAFACGAAIVVELMIAVVGTALSGVHHSGAHVSAGFGSPSQIGTLLLTRYLAPFEIASYLLLVAAVGAVVLGRRRGGIDSGIEERPPRVVEVGDLFGPRPAGTGTMAEAGGALEAAER